MNGEMLSLPTLSGSSSVKWVKDLLLAQKQPFTWYKATFDAPEGNDPLASDMGSMGKGQIWINGEGIGRHWPGYIASGDCGECNYAGLYSETVSDQLRDAFSKMVSCPATMVETKRESVGNI